MAKFYTITQKGFTFTCHDADKMVEDEEWTIERVAAFVAVHYTMNVMATRYVKGMTFRTAIASIMYTLKCDDVTSKDINKLTNYLVPKLCGIYEDETQRKFLGRALNLILDDVVIMAQDHIAEEQKPIEQFGRIVERPPFFSRPSKVEYDALQAEEQSREQALWDNFKEILNSGEAAGHRISVKDGANIYTAIIVKVTPKCVYCDLKDEYGRLFSSGARIPRNSSRWIIESLR